MSESKPLLLIELENESSLPKVFYKGEEINRLVHVGIDWDTETNAVMGGLTYTIEHDENKKYPSVNRIERRIRGHA